MPTEGTPRPSLTRFAWLSVAAAIGTIALKLLAYNLTGSVGLLSDAIESLVNLVGACMALAMLTVAARPVDEGHDYGHTKAEYFSSGVEGCLILVAAASIAVAAAGRLITPKPIEQAGLGLAVSVGASLVNLGVSVVLQRAGRRYRSISLEANARHLMTDVWTSAGVVLGVAGVALSGWQRLDPLVALVVAGNIVWAGVRIVRGSVLGLLDTALPAADQAVIRGVLAPHEAGGVAFHALRTRQAGAHRFVAVDVLVPGAWTVQQGHDLLETLDAELRAALPSTTLFTHLEPLEDPRSHHDIPLVRK